MSNYVHNYVICDEKAKVQLEDLMARDNNKLSGVYETGFHKIEDDTYLIIFDTLGMEYRFEFITDFIRENHDTLWYCIEECLDEQGYFFWNRDIDDTVILARKKLFPGCAANCIRIEYTYNAFKPLYNVYIFDGQMLIEDYLFFETRRYSIGEKSQARIDEYVRSQLSKFTGDFMGYSASHYDNIETEIKFDYDRECFWFDQYTPLDNDNCKEGLDEYNKFFEFIHSVLADEGIDEDLTFAGLSADFTDNFAEKLATAITV